MEHDEDFVLPAIRTALTAPAAAAARAHLCIIIIIIIIIIYLSGSHRERYEQTESPGVPSNGGFGHRGGGGNRLGAR